MKVHITSTPEYSKENINSVVEVLSQVPGELEFIAGEPISIERLVIENEKFEHPEGIESLTFKELFDLCKLYRVVHTLSNNVFVVLLTTIRNDRNWFSAFSNRNIFIDVNDWDIITEKDSKYSIAYQVVENIFQFLIGIDITDVENEPNIHGKTTGCINDMCGREKDQIKNKLRAGHICTSCLNRALDGDIDPAIILQIQMILDKVRLGLLNVERVIARVNPPVVTINEKGTVTVGEKTLTLQAIQKTMFIFYLKHPEGVKLEDLERWSEELYKIYTIIKPSGNYSTIESLCQPYTSPSPTFQKVKTDLNKSLKHQIGEPMSDFYIINKFDVDGYSFYKIKLSPDCRNVDPRF